MVGFSSQEVSVVCSSTALSTTLLWLYTIRCVSTTGQCYMLLISHVSGILLTLIWSFNGMEKYHIKILD